MQKRSAVPLVLGVLAIAFSGLGLLSALTATLMWNDVAEHVQLSDAGAFGVWVPMCMALAMVVFSIHLGSGG